MHLFTTLNRFLFNKPSRPEIYTLSLHDALPIWLVKGARIEREINLYSSLVLEDLNALAHAFDKKNAWARDRKSTRLNSSHSSISYAVFCLKKKTNQRTARLPVSTFPPR